MAVQPYTSHTSAGGARPGWRDVVVFVAVFALLTSISRDAHAMWTPFNPVHASPIDLSPRALPGYAARSLLRMFIAFGASLIFTFIYAYVAAYNLAARKILIPMLDILQSIPVLGFLSVTVTGFMALFPGSEMGLECASIFAIFTGQAWNMTFSFYQSLVTIPRELNEAAAIYRLNAWQRFTRLELPFGMIGLVWNSMMSFGGGWFFLAASEAISVLNHNYQLPGIGSYMAAAQAAGDSRAVLWSIATMVAIVVLVDQVFWRPIVAWSQKFKFEQTDSAEQTSAVLDFLRHSAVVTWLELRVGGPIGRLIDRGVSKAVDVAGRRGLPSGLRMALGILILGSLAVYALYGAWRGMVVVSHELGPPEYAHAFLLGLLTLSRVAVMVVVASVVWTPIGVAIGFSPRLARFAQPLVQIGASFPANLLFPLVVLGLIRLHITSLNWASIFLLALGTQWYILFNVIAGASAVPSDLREAALVFRLRGWHLWRTLILPAIFPAWVTGALTAAGGAWNASIVAEVASWGNRHLHADGLGAYVADATVTGDWPRIILGIGVMSLYVITLNRCIWRPLYALAESRYKLE
ncbi:MAG: ABC transporter permease [Capsulimonadaceae bacterium]